MVEIAGFEIERPDSLFGRHSYPREQYKMLMLTNEILAGAFFVNPLFAGLPPEIINVEKLPDDFRISRINRHFKRAKRILNNLGV